MTKLQIHCRNGPIIHGTLRFSIFLKSHKLPISLWKQFKLSKSLPNDRITSPTWIQF